MVSTLASVVESSVKTQPGVIVQPLGSIIKMCQGLLRRIMENNVNKFSAEIYPGVAPSIKNVGQNWDDIIQKKILQKKIRDRKNEDITQGAWLMFLKECRNFYWACMIIEWWFQNE